MQTARGPHVPGLPQVVRSLGLRGLYYGLSATLCRDIPFSMIFFAVFSTLKSRLSKTHNRVWSKDEEKEGPPLSIVFASGIVAGLSAALLATPMDGKTKTRARNTERYGASVLGASFYRVRSMEAEIECALLPSLHSGQNAPPSFARTFGRWSLSQNQAALHIQVMKSESRVSWFEPR